MLKEYKFELLKADIDFLMKELITFLQYLNIDAIKFISKNQQIRNLLKKIEFRIVLVECQSEEDIISLIKNDT